MDAILALPESSRITLLAPKIRRKKGEHREIFEAAKRAGFVRLRVNGEIMLVEDTDTLTLDKQKWHYIDIVVDRLIIRGDTEPNRVTESVETALREGEGVLTVGREGEDDLTFSEQFACVACGISLPEIEPRTFSFNSPHGACSTCTGLGYQLEVDPSLVIQNRSLSLLEGRGSALGPFRRGQLLVRQHDGSRGAGVRLLAPRAGARTHRRPGQRHPLRRRQKAGESAPSHRPGPHLRLEHHLRGRHPQPAAPLPRHRVRPHPQRD